MFASFEIQSSTGAYRVEVERGSFAKSLHTFSGSAVIADEFFRPRFVEAGTSAAFIEAIEANKSLDASPGVIERLRKGGANRQTELVALGGGIIQDLSAFVASVYMRGLKWRYLPTTVLAMADSCIGGKSSINVGPYKNLVGTVHPPHLVLIDPELIHTLPEVERASGLVEAAKICFCKGHEAFERHLAYSPSPTMPIDSLEPLIVNSLQAKKWFIEIDEFDKKERLLLNFGHTFGHALEGATHFAISHGLAVGLGMVCALEFQKLRGVDYSKAPKVAALQAHLDEMIAPWASIAEELRGVSLDDVIERFSSDKKHGTHFYAVIVVTKSGEVELQKVDKTPATVTDLRLAIRRMIERYT